MPATTWITDAVLKEACANAIGQEPSDLASSWDSLIGRANVDAYWLVFRKMAERGYTPAQINTWVERETFNCDIGLLFALQRKGILSTFSDTFIRSIDRRKELESALLIDDSGNLVYPSGAGQESITDKMDYTGYEFDPAIDFTFNNGMRQHPGNQL